MKKVVGYGLQLREKQKAKRIYFTLETQFRAYYQKAANKTGVTGELLLQQLETRLDNVCYRLGFAMSRRQARQIVRHGHVQVNGRKVNIPSFQCKVGDEIAIREGSKAVGRFWKSRRTLPAASAACSGSTSIATISRARFLLCRSARTSTCRSTSS